MKEKKVMYFPLIDEYLRRETTAETWHKEHPGEISRLYHNVRYFREVSEGIYYANFSPEFMIYDLIVMKESRYTRLYPGFHDYFEITFIYSGESVYTINGKEIHLYPGDIVLIQKGIVRSSDYSDQEDIIINIVFKEEMVNLNFLKDFSGNEYVYNFFANSFFKKGNEEGFIVIRNHHNHLLDLALECVCTLYYSERKFNHTQLMSDYFHVLFQQLVLAVNENGDYVSKEEKHDHIIYRVLNYISTHYQDGSLQSISQELGYNYNYLSNLIKQRLGKPFSQIKLEYQLNIAYHLIKFSDLPIYEICQQCGFQNRNYFYKKFEQRYQILPKNLRMTSQMVNAKDPEIK